MVLRLVPVLLAAAPIASAQGLYEELNDFEPVPGVLLNGNIALDAGGITGSIDPLLTGADFGATVEGAISLDVLASTSGPYAANVPLPSVPLIPFQVGTFTVSPWLLFELNLSGNVEAGMELGMLAELAYDAGLHFTPLPSGTITPTTTDFEVSEPSLAGGTVDFSVGVTAYLAFFVTETTTGILLGAPFTDLSLTIDLTASYGYAWQADATLSAGAGFYLPLAGVLFPVELFPPVVVPIASGTLPGTPSPVRWSRSYHLATSEDVTSMTPISDGGFLLVGNGQGLGNKGWIARLDEDGSIVWEKKSKVLSELRPAEAHETADGGFVVGGNRTTAIARVDRYDADGNVLWSNEYESPDASHIALTSIVETSEDGGYAFTGEINHGTYSIPVVVRLDASGNVLWAKELDMSWVAGDLAGCAQIIETSDNGLLMVGDVEYADDPVAPLIDGRNALVMKVNAAGDLQFAMAVGTLGFDYATCVAESPSGNDVYAFGGRLSDTFGYEAGWVCGMFGSSVLWSRALAGEEIAGSAGDTPHDEITAIAPVGETSYVCTGTTGLANDTRDSWLFRIGNGGGLSWFKSYRGIARDDLVGVRGLDDGVLAWGHTKSTTPLGVGGGEFDMWALRTSHDGFLHFKADNGFDVHNDKGIAIEHDPMEIPFFGLPASLVDIVVTSTPITLEHEVTAAVVELLTK